MHKHKDHAKGDGMHGGSHMATHSMKSGHPLGIVIGAVAMGISALMKDRYYHKCERCGHSIEA